MESAFCCLALQDGFMPISAKITDLDPMCDGVPILTAPTDVAPRLAIGG